MHTQLWLDNLNERDHLEDISVNGKIILEWIIMNQGGKLRTGFMWLMIRTSGWLLWKLLYALGSIRNRDFLDWLSECWLLKKDSGISLCRKFTKLYEYCFEVFNTGIACKWKYAEYPNLFLTPLLRGWIEGVKCPSLVHNLLNNFWSQ